MRIKNESVLDGRDLRRMVGRCARHHGLPWSTFRGFHLHVWHSPRMTSIFDLSIGPWSAELLIAPPERWHGADVIDRLGGLDDRDDVPPRVLHELAVALDLVIQVKGLGRRPRRPKRLAWLDGCVVRLRRAPGREQRPERRPTAGRRATGVGITACHIDR